MPKHRAGITSRGYRGHSSTLPFFTFFYREILAIPRGLDKNAFSVSGNVFFRLSRTSEYAMQHVGGIARPRLGSGEYPLRIALDIVRRQFRTVRLSLGG